MNFQVTKVNFSIFLVDYLENNHECANHNLSVNANVSEVFSKFFSEKINNVRTGF